MNGLDAAAIPIRHAIDRDTAMQQLGGHAVCLHQAVRGDARNGADGLRQALVVQPGLRHPGHIAQIQGIELTAQRAFLHHLSETGAAGLGRLVQVTGHITPAHRGQLLNKRTFDFVQFPMHKYPIQSLSH